MWNLFVLKGSFFGEIGCLIGGIRTAGVKALSTCETQAISKRNLHILLSEYPGVDDELQAVARQRKEEMKELKKKTLLRQKSKIINKNASDDSIKVVKMNIVDDRTLHKIEKKEEKLKFRESEGSNLNRLFSSRMNSLVSEKYTQEAQNLPALEKGKECTFNGEGRTQTDLKFDGTLSNRQKTRQVTMYLDVHVYSLESCSIFFTHFTLIHYLSFIL